MKLYITGSVASGKSTLARRLEKETGVPCYHLDEVVYEDAPMASWGNKKRPLEERERRFHEILEKKSYIIEDAGRDCFLIGMEQVDQVVVLEIPLALRFWRIIFRWTKQRLGLERCIYKPRLAMLKAMFRWARNYDVDKDGTKSRIASFSEKAIFLHNAKEIKSYIDKVKREQNVRML